MEQSGVSKEPINPYLAKILVSEIIFFNKQELNGQSKPVQCVLGYKDKLMELMEEVQINVPKQVQYKGTYKM